MSIIKLPLFSFAFSGDLNKSAALVKYVQYIENNCLSRQNFNLTYSNFFSIAQPRKDIIGLNNLLEDVLTKPLRQLNDFLLINMTNKAIFYKNLSCIAIFADPICKIYLNIVK